MHQLNLFDQPKRPGPLANRTRTSIEAAERIAPHAATQRGTVYAAIVAARHRGMTRNELVMETGLKLQSVCGRCHELLEQHLIWQGDEARDGGKVLRPSGRAPQGYGPDIMPGP